jgi:hypothetical protein
MTTVADETAKVVGKADMQAALVLGWLRREYLDGRVSAQALRIVAEKLQAALEAGRL